MTTQLEKCEQFAKLHANAKPFIIPNPWDAGSAKILQSLGFRALATTSAGFAYTRAKTDGQFTLEEKLLHCSSLVNATTIPISADFENGFADDPETVSINIRKLAATGVAGCSIEDYSRDSNSLYDFNHAVERIEAAVESVAALQIPFQLTARAENLLRGRNDLDDTIRRLQAFEKAGANVLYAPGIKSLDQLQQTTDALNKPFNVLSAFFKNVSVDEFSAAGAKRISLGGALTWATIRPLLDASKEMLERGTFNWSNHLVSGSEIRILLA